MSALPPAPLDPFWQTLCRRRSIRRYDGRSLTRPQIERLLTAAVWAPNAHNRQPWRFAVLADPARQQGLAAALAAAWAKDLAAEGAGAAEIARRLAISQARIGGAGALVLGCLSMAEMDSYPTPERQQLEWLLAVQSTALALGNLLLAAQHEGLAACWMCAPLFAPAVVQRALDLPADWQPQALITLGYAAETRTKTRKPLDEVVVWL